MKIYLSARYARREELCAYREQLIAAGHECTARWLDGEGDDLGENAAIDVEDVLRADTLVNFTDEPAEYSPHPWASRGGRHVEAGIALGAGIPVVIVGPRENIFHHLPPGCVRVVDTFDDALRWYSWMGVQRDRFVASAVGLERTTCDRFTHAAFGIASEAGEIAALGKRAMVRGGLESRDVIDPLDVLDEFGDVQYYIAIGLDAFGLTMRAAQEWNMRKLRSRSSHGKDKKRERKLLEQFAREWGIIE